MKTLAIMIVTLVSVASMASVPTNRNVANTENSFSLSNELQEVKLQGAGKKDVQEIIESQLLKINPNNYRQNLKIKHARK